MVKNRIFIENKYEKKLLNSNDTKKKIIETQTVLKKRSFKKIIPFKETFSNSTFKSRYLYNLKITKFSFVILGAVSLILLCIIPLFINIRSYFWEMHRVLKIENDVVYNQFLIDEEKKGSEKKKTTLNKSVTIPSLKIKNYKVKKGDSLFGLANKFNVSVDSIITLNDLKNAYYLTIGTILKIPNMSGILYKVKKGDSLSSISRKYNVAINSIADSNDLSSSTIHIGMSLFIPGGTLSAWDRMAVIGEFFKKPTKGRLTSKMGFRIDPFTGRVAYHPGIDIANKQGTAVYASQFGRVIFAGYKGNYGKTVVIVHPRGYSTLYAHLSRIIVKKGQAVKQGKKIGLMGSTGRSTGSHLHFEVHQKNKLTDPLKVVKMF